MPRMFAASRGGSSFCTACSAWCIIIWYESYKQYAFIWILCGCRLKTLPGTTGAVTFPSHQVSGLSFPRLQYARATGMSGRCTLGEGTLEKVTNEEIRRAVELFWSTFLANQKTN